MTTLRVFRILIPVILLFISSYHSAAQSAINVTENIITSNYPSSLSFQLAVSGSAEIQNISLQYWTNGTSCQSVRASQEIDITPSTSIATEWEWDFTLSGVLPPGAEITWQWEITDFAGNKLVTDEQTYQVNDTRHTWNLLTSEGINLQWYKGDWSFGRSLQQIAIQSLDRLKSDAGVSPSGDIWITVYPSAEEIKEVDIHVYKWAGGIAYPEYNSTIIGISTTELEWAAEVIPHELAHLVTESVVFNCKGVHLPTWLSEGLAKYAEGEISQPYIDLVRNALKDKELPPLRTLESGFSSNPLEANISYGHSGMVVTYMIDKFGPEKMASLLSTIQAGNKIDKALLAVYALDTDGIEAKWRISQGFKPQATLAPTSANRTAVPTMALWTSVIKMTNTPTSLPTGTATLVPFTDTPQPLPSATPTEITVESVQDPTDLSAQEITAKPSLWIVALAVALFFVIGGIVIFLVFRNRRKIA